MPFVNQRIISMATDNGTKHISEVKTVWLGDRIDGCEVRVCQLMLGPTTHIPLSPNAAPTHCSDCHFSVSLLLPWKYWFIDRHELTKFAVVMFFKE